jgi:hypothetical protein
MVVALRNDITHSVQRICSQRNESNAVHSPQDRHCNYYTFAAVRSIGLAVERLEEADNRSRRSA